MSLGKPRVGRASDNDIWFTPWFGVNRWGLWFALLFLTVLYGGYSLLRDYPWGEWLVNRLAWALIAGLAVWDLLLRLRTTHYAVEVLPGVEQQVAVNWWERLLFYTCGLSLRFSLLITLRFLPPIPVWLLAGGIALHYAVNVPWHWLPPIAQAQPLP